VRGGVIPKKQGGSVPPVTMATEKKQKKKEK
jgi:hypothetical protein